MACLGTAEVRLEADGRMGLVNRLYGKGASRCGHQPRPCGRQPRPCGRQPRGSKEAPLEALGDHRQRGQPPRSSVLGPRSSVLGPRSSVRVAGSWVPAPQCRAVGPRSSVLGAGCRVPGGAGRRVPGAGWCRPPGGVGRRNVSDRLREAMNLPPGAVGVTLSGLQRQTSPGLVRVSGSARDPLPPGRRRPGGKARRGPAPLLGSRL